MRTFAKNKEAKSAIKEIPVMIGNGCIQGPWRRTFESFVVFSVSSSSFGVLSISDLVSVENSEFNAIASGAVSLSSLLMHSET